MALGTREPELHQPLVDLAAKHSTTNGSTSNGSTSNGSSRPGAPRRSTGGRPPWMSLALALIAGALALAGGWLLLNNDEEAASAAPMSLVIQAQVPLAEGLTTEELLSASTDWLTVKSIPEDLVLASTITSIDQLRTLDGQRLATPVLAGETLTTSRFEAITTFEGEAFIDRVAAVDTPEGHLKVAVRLPPNRALAGSLAAGDTVAVLASFNAIGEQENITALLLPAVEVIDVRGNRGGPADDATLNDSDEPPLPGEEIDDISKTDFDVTIAVTPVEATRLAYAVEYGQIMLAVASEDAADDDIRYADTLNSVLGLEEQIELENPNPDATAAEAEEAQDDADTDGESAIDAEASSEDDSEGADDADDADSDSSESDDADGDDEAGQ